VGEGTGVALEAGAGVGVGGGGVGAGLQPASTIAASKNIIVPALQRRSVTAAASRGSLALGKHNLKRRIMLCRQQTLPLSSPTGNFCGTHGRFVVFSPLSHGLWLSLVERLNGVQEVPGSNPGSPIFQHLGELLRSEEVRWICEVLRTRQFAVSSLWALGKSFGSCKARGVREEAGSVIAED
jgi:hypothetical protein